MNNFEEPTALERALAEERDSAAPVTEDELVEFALGKLEEPRAEAVRERLANDPAAARRVLDLKASLAGEPPPGEAPLSAAELEVAWGRLEALRNPTAPTTLLFQPRQWGSGGVGLRSQAPALAWGLAALLLLFLGAALLWGGQGRRELARQRLAAEQLRAERVRGEEQLAELMKPASPQAIAQYLFVPADQDLMRGEPPRTARRRVDLSAGPAFVGLSAPRSEAAATLELRILDRLSGKQVMNLGGLRVMEGVIPLLLPQQSLPPGVYVLKLDGKLAQGRQELAVYELEVLPGSPDP